MPFPASNGALSDAVETAARVALHMKSSATQAVALMGAQNVTSRYLIDMESRLHNYRADLDRVRQVPGIGPYAQAQLGSPTLDVAAEFNAMLVAIDAVILWMRDNFPKDANGFLLAQTWGENGVVDRQFSPAQTAGLRTQLSALIATVA